MSNQRPFRSLFPSTLPTATMASLLAMSAVASGTLTSCGGQDNPRTEIIIVRSSERNGEQQTSGNGDALVGVTASPAASATSSVVIAAEPTTQPTTQPPVPSPEPTAQVSLTPEATVTPGTPPTPPTGDSQAYVLVSGPGGGTGVTFTIPYTFGIHKGTAEAASGKVVILASRDALVLKEARFSVPVDGLRTGDRKRDCHLREAMGIKYDGSRYPGAHACDGANVLPVSGPDSVVFPNIEFDLKKASITGTQKSLAPGKTIELEAEATWTMHGVSKAQALPLRVTLQTDGTVRVTGATSFSIAAFGMVVKPFLGISVKDTASAAVDLSFKPQGGAN